MGYAFISYNSKQRKDADTLKEILNVNGIRTWMARGDIGGSVYAETNALIDTIATEEFDIDPNGYSREQVDKMLDGICDRLDRPDFNQRTLAECNFYADSIKLKKEARGYSVSHVDTFLLDIKYSIIRILSQ